MKHVTQPVEINLSYIKKVEFTIDDGYHEIYTRDHRDTSLFVKTYANDFEKVCEYCGEELEDGKECECNHINAAITSDEMIPRIYSVLDDGIKVIINDELSFVVEEHD